VVIADDDAEARLIGSLSPLPLDGVVSKASSLTVLQDALFTALSCPSRGTEGTKTIGILIKAACSVRQNEKYCALCRMAIRCRRCAQLERNIKTIRAHKFNVMSKLGVSSDAGLLDAADILLYLRAGEPAPFMQAAS
jgi:hypothetical protein